MIYIKKYNHSYPIFFILLASILFSCEEESNLAFSEINILEEKEAIVEINIPQAMGGDLVSSRINSELIEFTNNALNIDSVDKKLDTFDKGIEEFNLSFDRFTKSLNEEIQLEITPWEVAIDGEVTYLTNNLICVAMTTYLNTGAIHGTSKITFLNFDGSTGELLDFNSLIDDKIELKKIIKPYFEKEVGTISDKDFKLPESIGLDDEGIIILYNKNEIPSYTDRLTEFKIPFSDVKSILKVY